MYESLSLSNHGVVPVVNSFQVCSGSHNIFSHVNLNPAGIFLGSLSAYLPLTSTEPAPSTTTTLAIAIAIAIARRVPRVALIARPPSLVAAESASILFGTSRFGRFGATTFFDPIFRPHFPGFSVFHLEQARASARNRTRQPAQRESERGVKARSKAQWWNRSARWGNRRAPL